MILPEENFDIFFSINNILNIFILAYLFMLKDGKIK